MSYESELYTLIYNQRYRLHNENFSIVTLIFNFIYHIINVNDVVHDLIIDEKYLTIKTILTLFIKKEFLRKHT